MPIYRVFLEPMSLENSGDKKLWIDLAFRKDGTVDPSVPTFGVYGDGFPNRNLQPTVMPFLLYKDGSMDFGAYDGIPYGEDSRTWECNIFSSNKVIEIGELVCITHENEEHEYRIKNVNQL